MIKVDSFEKILKILGFTNENNIYTKHFDNVDCDLKVDFTNQKLIYPTDKGFEVNDGTTSNFEHPENFVVFECVCRLLEKGYRPEHIELEPRWSLGHGGKSGKADICVKNKDGSPYLCIIECKTSGSEYRNELQNMLNSDEKHSDGGQLFSYWQQERSTKWLCLYASDFVDEKLTHSFSYVSCSDDSNVVELAKDDTSILLYKDSGNAKELFAVWKETYKQKIINETDIIFDDETVAYDIGVLPLKKKRLVDFSRDDKIVNQFEEILRHNNVSDKENAFNRLIALFIAKLYDEKTKTLDSEVEFQYKTGTDTYQKMQDRLQKLHHFGMKEFMKEEVFYVADDYVKTVMRGAIGENREKLEAELNETITKLKFYTNNDFAFKDVHNKALFYQNGKILVEMVELFQKYRIIDSNELQLLGDMFEQLLNKGFKQNEGQFFTPIPITCFIWKCLPLESIITGGHLEQASRHSELVSESKPLKQVQGDTFYYPKVIDYACGAGHFLTEGFREINETVLKLGLKAEKGWERDCIFGIEKDYRLARVSKISMFMHGADNGNIVFGDGLDNHNEKIVIENGQFDILVANPPYSVSAFKNHLELKNNGLNLLQYISKDGKEIETLFVERISQLLKPNGIAAVILPSSILSNSSTSYIKAREEILKNFAVHAIVQFGSKTFGATGTNTVVLYLQKNSEPPVKSEITKDNVTAIFENEELNVTSDREVLKSYCEKISVPKEEYIDFLKGAREAGAEKDWKKYKDSAYFGLYAKEFESSTDFKKLKAEKQSKAFFDYALEIEKEKLYFFALVYKQNTLVVTAPNDNAEQEKFLGYSWSNRKGDEGIKIKSSTPQNSCGLLYNVYDEENSIARYVKDSFLGIYRNGKYISVNALKDMIDFSRTTFDKAIKPNVQTENGKMKIESKFPLVKLGDICEKPMYGANVAAIDGNPKTDYRYIRITDIDDNGYLNDDWKTAEEIDEKYILKDGDFLFARSGATAGKTFLYNEKLGKAIYAGYLIKFSPKKNVLNPKYLNNLTHLSDYKNWATLTRGGTAQPNINAEQYSQYQIPLPPLDVQKSIVAECDKIDGEYQNAQKQIEESKEKIIELMESSLKDANDVYKLSNKDIFDISIGRRILSTEINESFDIPVYSANVFEPFGKINKLLIKDFSVPSVLWGIDGDWQVNVIAENQPFYPTDHCGVLRIKNNQLEPKYLAYVFEQEGKKEGFKRSYRASIDRIEAMSVTLPPFAEQQKIVRKISALEDKIAAAKKIMSECPERKQAVLDKWLR